jgi:hypothetical protein
MERKALHNDPLGAKNDGAVLLDAADGVVVLGPGVHV